MILAPLFNTTYLYRSDVVDIYVLECQDGKIYVGKTTKGVERLKQHIKGRGAEWTKMHKPTRIIDYYTDAEGSDERKITDQMIRKHGANNVRGAGLTKRKMTRKEIANLNKKVGFTGNSAKKKTRKPPNKKAKTYTRKTKGKKAKPKKARCKAKTDYGLGPRCKLSAKPGSNYCRVHARYFR